MEPIHVLSTMRFDKALLARIRAVSDRIVLVQHTSPDAAHVPAEAFEQAEVLYTFGALPRPDQAPHLRWVQLNSAGVNHILKQPLYTTPVIFTTTSGLHAINIAEYVLASMLAWAHRLPEFLDLQRKREWPSDRWTRFPAAELRGATLGIVGYGSIGREVGRLGKAFGMKVLALKRHPQSPENTNTYEIPALHDPAFGPDQFYGPEGLLEMLHQCDYVVIAVPLTPETRGMIGETQLRAMKPNAYLVNIARGEVCDESALVRALAEKWIAGAGLDVFTQEPLPATSPLWTQPNVILTPHISGMTPNYEQRAVDIFCENLRRYVAGEPLLNVVDKSAGY